MNKVEKSLFIEANYPLSERGRPRKPVYVVGVNDAPYFTKPMINGYIVTDPAYVSWSSMLDRAYGYKLQARCQTYLGVTACEEWHSFVAFRKWWLENYREGWQLDKDLLVVGNREYGPDACIYVPAWLNTFTIDGGAARGDFPIGVSIHNRSGRYQSHCSNKITGKRKNLGLFATPEEAHQSWLNYKLSLAEQLKPEMDAIDSRIYPNVVTIIKAA